MINYTPFEYDTNIRRDCPICRKSIPGESLYCPFCGTYLKESEREHPNKPHSISKILTATVIAIAAIFVIFLQNKNGEGFFRNKSQMQLKVSTPTPISTPSSVPTEAPTPVPTEAPTPVPTETPPPTPTIIPAPTEIADEEFTYVKGIKDPTTNDYIYIPGATASSYVWPDADTRYYSEDDLRGMSEGQIRYLINEIYARAGYTFKNSLWGDYFSKKTWYSATISNAEFNSNPKMYLNIYEYQNVEMITNYQHEHGFQEYP